MRGQFARGTFCNKRAPRNRQWFHFQSTHLQRLIIRAEPTKLLSSNKPSPQNIISSPWWSIQQKMIHLLDASAPAPAAVSNLSRTPQGDSTFTQTTLPEITFVNNKELAGLLENTIQQEEETGNYPSNSYLSYELIIESQSGFSLFGINFFSTLFIPAKFQSILDKNYSDLKNIPFDDLNSSWIWKNWYIVMLNDVDDKGWCYSYRLNSKNWSGRFRFRGLRFFRRRLLMRLKLVCDELIPETDVNEIVTNSESLMIYSDRK